MNVYNPNGDIVYSCSLRGEPLREYYRKELDRLANMSGGLKGYGSTILDFGNLSRSPLSYDHKMIVDLAARRMNYLSGANVKPFVVTPLEECLFYELS